MKKTLLTLIGLTLALVPASEASSSKTPKTLPGGWVIKWADEFNGSRLNDRYWSPELGVIRNKGTLQTYTKDCIKVKGGNLILHSKAKETKNISYVEGSNKWFQQAKTMPYASGSITSKGKLDFTYGRLEVRAKMPEAKGAWPAIWLIGSNGWGWPKCGEIDILEHLSQSPGKCYMTLHWGNNGTQSTKSKGFTVDIPNPYGKFHIYAMEWDEQKMKMFVDDKEVASWDLSAMDYPDGTNPFHTPHHLILNTAIGGNGTWPEHADSKDYPVNYMIDYVRYYVKEGSDEHEAPLLLKESKTSSKTTTKKSNKAKTSASSSSR